MATKWVRASQDVPEKLRLSLVIDTASHPALAAHLMQAPFRGANQMMIDLMQAGLQALGCNFDAFAQDGGLLDSACPPSNLGQRLYPAPHSGHNPIPGHAQITPPLTPPVKRGRGRPPKSRPNGINPGVVKTTTPVVYSTPSIPRHLSDPGPARKYEQQELVLPPAPSQMAGYEPNATQLGERHNQNPAGNIAPLEPRTSTHAGDNITQTETKSTDLQFKEPGLANRHAAAFSDPSSQGASSFTGQVSASVQPDSNSEKPETPGMSEHTRNSILSLLDI